ncbi:Uncharacterised protein [Yersinia pseudotuberculosis]|nr:Uncharacterised protein [Yersinia pseudotuberculosis]
MSRKAPTPPPYKPGDTVKRPAAPPPPPPTNEQASFYLILKSVSGQHEKQHKHAVLISSGL